MRFFRKEITHGLSLTTHRHVTTDPVGVKLFNVELLNSSNCERSVANLRKGAPYSPQGREKRRSWAFWLGVWPACAYSIENQYFARTFTEFSARPSARDFSLRRKPAPAPLSFWFTVSFRCGTHDLVEVFNAVNSGHPRCYQQPQGRLMPRKPHGPTVRARLLSDETDENRFGALPRPSAS